MATTTASSMSGANAVMLSSEGIGSTSAPSQPDLDDVMHQAVIHAQGWVSSNDWSRRVRNTDALDKDERFGAATDANDTHVLHHEFVFTMRIMRGRRGMGGLLSPNSVNMQTTFNGEEVDVLTTDQLEYESTWRFLGIAADNFLQNSPSQPKSGFGLRVRGSATTFNNGPDDFNAGDLILWRLPPLNAADRDKHNREVPTIPGIRKRRIIGYPKRFVPSDILDYTRMPVDWLMDEEVDDDLKLLDRLDGNNYSDTPLMEEIALAKKESVLTDGFAVIATLLEAGVLSVNAPGDKLDEMSMFSRDNYERNDNVLDMTLGDKEDGRYVFTPNRDTGVIGLERVDADAYAEHYVKMANQLKVVAAYLGLISENPNKAHVRPKHGLVDLAVGRAISPLSTNPEFHDTYSLSQIFKNKVHTMTAGVNTSFDARRLDGQILARQSSGAQRGLVASQLLNAELDEHVVGVALGESKKGGTLHFAM